MMSFKDNFFFVKFSILFFIVTIFGYWGIDLNSEELYIAFSFFFLVIIAFSAVRTSMLLFFLNTVNRKYLRLLVDLNRIRLILTIRSASFAGFISAIKARKARIYKFLEFNASFLPTLLGLSARLFAVNAHKFFISLALNLNYFIFNSARVRRTVGFFENSSRVFSILI